MSTTSDENPEFKDLFTQDGVLLKASVGRPISELNSIGMLCIVEYIDNTKFIEWRPNDLITIETATQDQEWALVDTVARRQRTFSGNITADYAAAKARVIKIPMDELKSFRITKNYQQMQFSTKLCVWQHTFYFQHGNSETFVGNLKCFLKTAKCRNDKHTFLVLEANPDSALRHSFAELDLFTENPTDYVWNFASNLRERPYAATMEVFSKLLYYNISDEKRETPEDSELNGAIESGKVYNEPRQEYQVVSVKSLPPRPLMPRGAAVTADTWENLLDPSGRVTEVDGVKHLIYRGGVAYPIRPTVWKYLLGYYPWDMSQDELYELQKRKKREYQTMKLQWTSMTQGQEERFSEYRERKSLVEKDVKRTDRSHSYYAGDDNPNIQVLENILMTYVMYNFDLGYVQGMSDLLAPILLLFGNEEDSFWAFVGFMDKIGSNFDMDVAAIKTQLLQIKQLIDFVNPELARYFEQKGSDNMYFCFRWLLVWFKREFDIRDIMRLWEVLWTNLPCPNFHLLIAVAILDMEKETIISKNYGFNEILKHINELSMKLHVDKVLSEAEGIYHQLLACEHLTDNIRTIIGQPLLNNSTSTQGDEASATVHQNNDTENASGGDIQVSPQVTLNADSGEVMYQIGLDMNF